MTDSFVHLHVHTSYSVLDGAGKIPEYVAKAAEDGMPAIGITDHGNMCGMPEFAEECEKVGIKAIPGEELYCAKEHVDERPGKEGGSDDESGTGKRFFHLTSLAMNPVGYANLVKLSSEAYLRGFWYKGRVAWDALERHNEGLIVTSSCLGGIILQEIMHSRIDKAREYVGRYQDIFGDRFYIEVQDHGIPEQKQTNPILLKFAQEFGIKAIATNDSHYLEHDHSVPHEILLCSQTHSTLSDPNRFKFSSDQHWLKTAQEMRYLFREIPEVCDNTLEIAERCEGIGKLKSSTFHLPNFPLPEGFTDTNAYLRHLVYKGAEMRWGTPSEEQRNRIDYELDVIAAMGLPSYFLVVWDLLRFARSQGIMHGPGRGSAASAIVCYLLKITEIDPLENKLYFERFLNPARVSPADIDIDLDTRYRDVMINYCADKYGQDAVAQIITFGTIKARSAVKDAARAMGKPLALAGEITRAMPPLLMGRDTPLEACLAPEAPPKYKDTWPLADGVRELYRSNPEAKEIMDMALGIEGLVRSTGIHAAAVVITDGDITDYVPVAKSPKGPVHTQYDMHAVEDLGLLKMDFLGLRNLDVISDTFKLVEQRHGTKLAVETIPLDDDKTYHMLQRGGGIGVFQLESAPMRNLMRSLRPESIHDIAALVALYRPGPMAANMHNDYADRKNGRKPIEYLHPDAEEILSDTYGLMIYQESMMRVAQKFAGYSLADSDLLRRACLPKGTLVVTEHNGYVPIEKVMQLKKPKALKINPYNGVKSYGEIDKVWDVGEKNVFRITTSSGACIEATANHQFYVGDEWVELGDVSEGDVIAVARNIVTDGGSKISRSEAILLALLISEGYTSQDYGKSWYFCNTDPELLELYKQMHFAFFEADHSREFTSKSGVTYIYLTSSQAQRLLARFPEVWGLSGDKTIPKYVLNAPKKTVSSFLATYLCCDGWIDQSGIHWGSKSRQICQSIKRMLLRLGIQSYVRVKNVKGYGTHYTTSVMVKDDVLKLIDELTDSGNITSIQAEKILTVKPSWTTAAQNPFGGRFGVPTEIVRSELNRRSSITKKSLRSLGIDSGATLDGPLAGFPLVSRLAESSKSERLSDLFSGDLSWQEVVKIEFVGTKTCYDFQMKDGEEPWAIVEDFLVHNCGKKVVEKMVVEKDRFIDGVIKTGYSKDLADFWWDIIEPFADYAFPKAHAYSYGFISYITAYLKANYPAEYFAALLTSVKDGLDKASIYLFEARHHDVQILPPDINISGSDFTPTDDDNIVFGLSAIRGIGDAPAEAIVEERSKNGPYENYDDFRNRVPVKYLKKGTIEALVKAGAFDSMHSRGGLLSIAVNSLDDTRKSRKAKDAGALSLLDQIDYKVELEVPEIDLDQSAVISLEREMLGIYLTAHPLDPFVETMEKIASHSLVDVREEPENIQVTVCGTITSLVEKTTRRGDKMGILTLQDLTDDMEIVVFPRQWAKISVSQDQAVVVKGKVGEESVKILADEVTPMQIESAKVGPEITGNALTIHVQDVRLDETTIASLKAIFESHPGQKRIILETPSGEQLLLPEKWSVSPRPGVLYEIRKLLGEGSI